MGDVAPLRLGTCTAAAALAAAALAGCGGGSKHEPAGGSIPVSKPPPTTSPPASGRPAAGRAEGHVERSHGVAVTVPRRWDAVRPVMHARTWPVPLRAIAPFKLARVTGNASCSKAVIGELERRPHAVYILVAEYTKPQPKGFPSPPPLGPRPDLAHLDLRPAEVECWDGGLSGAARFRDHGRGFYVEVLLGHDVTAAERRRALHALASMRIG